MEMNRSMLMYVLPILMSIAALEAATILLWRKQSYPWRESIASVAIAIGQRLSGLATAGLIAGLFTGLWQWRFFTVDMTSWWGPVLLFIGIEFFYYWQHRTMHECRWFWANHAVHHSPQHINLSGAYRIGWTGAITGAALFYVPLLFLGFSPQAISIALVLNLLYQFWLHTELVPRLGWLENILNTPSNHRVHHAINPQYLDANYGGVTVIFDRLFGTYVAEKVDDACRYGLVHQMNSNNPFTIVFREWIEIWRDVRTSQTWGDALRYIFKAPGWSHDNSRLTSEKIKALARAEEKQTPTMPSSPQQNLNSASHGNPQTSAATFAKPETI